MGNMDRPLGNATPITSLHQLHWWKSPRWIVIRIEALAVVAIIISFFLAAFGSCRRWSNRWIVQKGFLAAQVLSLSLGTYSIGLMQSSSVKSEMYPIWTVSLFTLFGCIDPVSTFNGLDYKGPLLKVVFGICLNCGYVLLMSISTISNVVGKATIITLSAITFVKGFHRSFALVQQNRMQDMMSTLYDDYKLYDDSLGEIHIMRKDPLSIGDERRKVIVDDSTHVSQAHIEESVRNHKDEQLQSCYDICVAFSLSHRLQRHFLGLGYRVARPKTLKGIDYNWALKIIEIELAFLYDIFYTGNPFLHYYQAKTASLWALASLTGICFVLVATAIPDIMTSRRSGANGGCTNVVDTTIADLAITFGILVFLALLQLTQLVGSWTSNWARVAVACGWASRQSTKNSARQSDKLSGWMRLKAIVATQWDKLSGWMRLKAIVATQSDKLSGWMRLKVVVATSTNMFDKYLWQDKISQYSMLPEPRLLTIQERKGEEISSSEPNWARKLLTGWKGKVDQRCYLNTKHQVQRIRWTCVQFVQTLGLHYIWQVIVELLSNDTNKRGGVKMDEDVKGSVTDFLSRIQSDELDENWLSSLPYEKEEIHYFLPHFSDPWLVTKPEMHCKRYTSCVMMWHIVTWYCELEEQKEEAPVGCGNETAASYLRKAAPAIPLEAGGGGGGKPRDHRRVANILSQYCVYLVKSSPELLPGPVAITKRVYNNFAREIKAACDKKTIDLENMSDVIKLTNWNSGEIHIDEIPDHRFQDGRALAKLLMSQPGEIWKTLELVWVQLLIYAAPYGNVEAHMRRLSQGGEFITHLWALLYHLDIRQWKFKENLTTIATEEDAKRVLTEDDQAAVAYMYSGTNYRDYDEAALASRLENGVRYYHISDYDLAMLFGIPISVHPPRVVFLQKEANNQKFTLYDGKFCAYDIAHFVTANKIALPQNQARAQSTYDSANQSSQDNGGQNEDEEEIQPHP